MESTTSRSSFNLHPGEWQWCHFPHTIKTIFWCPQIKFDCLEIQRHSCCLQRENSYFRYVGRSHLASYFISFIWEDRPFQAPKCMKGRQLLRLVHGMRKVTPFRFARSLENGLPVLWTMLCTSCVHLSGVQTKLSGMSEVFFPPSKCNGLVGD